MARMNKYRATRAVLVAASLGLAACGSDSASGGSGGPTVLDATGGDGGVDIGDVGTVADTAGDASGDTVRDAAEDSADDAGPADADPADTAADTDPADTDPADTDPADTDPGDTQPADTDPGDADPGDAAGDTDPADTAGDTDPGDTDPGDTGTTGRWQSFDPTADGDYGASRFEETINTSVQEVRTLVFLPEDGADAPYPVVVFNHGFSLRAENYEGYARRLASHGFVVLLPSIDDGLLSARTHTQLRDIQVEIDAWIAEAAERPGTRVFGVADPELLGVGGHSRGGKQAMLAAVTDDRIDAVFGVDPVDAGPPFGSNPTDYPSVTPELMDGLTVPSGYVGAGRGAEVAFPGSPECAPSDDNYAQYFAESPSPSYSWTIPEAGHNDFVENCDITCRFACPRSDDPEAVIAFAQTTMVAFFKVYLAGDTSYQAWLDGESLDDGVTLESR